MSVKHISKIDESIMANKPKIIEKENLKGSRDIATDLEITTSAYSNYKNLTMKRLIQTLIIKHSTEKYGCFTN